MIVGEIISKIYPPITDTSVSAGAEAGAEAHAGAENKDTIEV